MKQELITRLGQLLKELSAEMERSKQRLDQLKIQREKTDLAMRNYRDVDSLRRVIDENKEMVDRNNREIEYQRYLVVAVNATMKELREMDTKRTESNQLDDYFQRITQDVTILSADHPFRQDRDFLKSLLDYFETIEDYHACALVQKQLQSLD